MRDATTDNVLKKVSKKRKEWGEGRERKERDTLGNPRITIASKKKERKKKEKQQYQTSTEQGTAGKGGGDRVCKRILTNKTTRGLREENEARVKVQKEKKGTGLRQGLRPANINAGQIIQCCLFPHPSSTRSQHRKKSVAIHGEG